MILTDEGMVLAGVLLALLCGILFVCSLVEWFRGKGKRTAQVDVSAGPAGERGPWMSVRISSSGAHIAWMEPGQANANRVEHSSVN
jgi:hypothetical protein